MQDDLHYEVTDKTISGIGVSDNSAAVGVLVSLPEIFKRLNLQFASDIVLVAPILSLGRGNLKGIRRFSVIGPHPSGGPSAWKASNSVGSIIFPMA